MYWFFLYWSKELKIILLSGRPGEKISLLFEIGPLNINVNIFILIKDQIISGTYKGEGNIEYVCLSSIIIVYYWLCLSSIEYVCLLLCIIVSCCVPEFDYYWLWLSNIEYVCLVLITLVWYWLFLSIIDYFCLLLIIFVYYWLFLSNIEYICLLLCIIVYNWCT